jgi:hypothetical protein
MSQAWGKPYAYDNFVKFGGRGVLHHNKEMPTSALSIIVNVCLLATTLLPFPYLDRNILLKTIGDAIGYIILWP